MGISLLICRSWCHLECCKTKERLFGSHFRTGSCRPRGKFVYTGRLLIIFSVQAAGSANAELVPVVFS
jgi:hypothetical protein